MTSLSYRFLGDITDADFHGHGLEVACGPARLRVDVLKPELLRVRLAPEGRFDHGFSYAVAKSDWQPVEVAFEANAASLELRTASLICRMQRSPCRLTFLDAAGRLLAADADGLGWDGARRVTSHTMPAGAHFYGLGEKAFAIERRGRRFEMWNRDPACYTWYEEPIHQSIPFFLALLPSRSLASGGRTVASAAYGMLLDNPGRSFFDFGHSRPDVLSCEVESGELRYYFMTAPKLANVLETYTELTGRMALPPLWALGFHQARWSYPDESTVRRLALTFRQRRIPCDALYLDIDYMEGYRCFTWNEEAFPTHHQMIADLRRQGIKTVAIIDAGIKVDPGYRIHDEGLARGYFVKHRDGSPFHGPVWPGECFFPDFTDPAARAWWGDLYAGLVEEGIAGFWNDMNEPVIFHKQTMPDDVRHDVDGHGGSHGEVHNVYGMQMARATAEGLARLRPGQRQLVISRSAFAGHQRHAMVWTGDNLSTWEHLRLTIPMGLSLGLSGIAFSGADVGGFAGDCTGELLARWTQLGALTPFFRNHSANDTVDQEPWAFGAEIEAICRRAIELRYELLPYLVTVFWQASQSGLPVMRPLVLAYQSDPQVAALDTQFMLGDDLLVAPVLEPGVSGRSAYLPAGVWIDYWTGRELRGGRDVWIDAPLDRIPLLVKSGTVLPMQPVIQHTEAVPDELILRVYPGVGESLLYEDDGMSLAYQAGEWLLTRFACRGGGRWFEVTIRREGLFPSPRRRYSWRVYGLGREPELVQVDGQDVPGWNYDGVAGVLKLETAPCERLVVRG